MPNVMRQGKARAIGKEAVDLESKLPFPEDKFMQIVGSYGLKNLG
jgi:hypothetical protein